MKKFKRVLNVLIVGSFFAAMTMLLLILIVGAVMFAHAIVTESIPTGVELIGMIFLMLVGGMVGAMLYINDTGGDDDE